MLNTATVTQHAHQQATEDEPQRPPGQPETISHTRGADSKQHIPTRADGSVFVQAILPVPRVYVSLSGAE